MQSGEHVPVLTEGSFPRSRRSMDIEISTNRERRSSLRSQGRDGARSRKAAHTQCENDLRRIPDFKEQR